MKRRGSLVLSLAALAVGAAPVSAQQIAPGIELVPGRFVPGVQPDGNSLVIQAPQGLVVVDTGRHALHTRAILDLAKREHLPIAAVVNTHWHLDHTGGDILIRKAYPKVRVWASGAIDGALTGFLASYRGQLLEAIPQMKDPAAQTAYRHEVEIIDAGDALRPDETVTSSGERTIAGRRLRLGLEGPAVTKGDVWVLDPATGVLASGDLVTLPVPLLDTACPAGWQTALGHLAQVEFTTLVPGHGAPMTPAQLATYRIGFDHLLACAASDRDSGACIDGWLADLGDLVPAADRELARKLLEYYVPNVLRGDPSRNVKLCAPDAAR